MYIKGGYVARGNCVQLEWNDDNKSNKKRGWRLRRRRKMVKACNFYFLFFFRKRVVIQATTMLQILEKTSRYDLYDDGGSIFLDDVRLIFGCFPK